MHTQELAKSRAAKQKNTAEHLHDALKSLISIILQLQTRNLLPGRSTKTSRNAGRACLEPRYGLEEPLPS